MNLNLTCKRTYALGFAVVLSLTAFLAKAEVPRETLERLADIKVAFNELSHLTKIGKLTGAEYNDRRKALDNEARTVWDRYRQISRDDRISAENTIDGLARSKLSILIPRWQKEEEEYRQTIEENRKQNSIALEDDARSAAEFQGQRILLQQQLDSGVIDRDTFTLKDREALDAIAGLRKKYEGPDRAFAESAQRFDQRMDQLTKAIADNPSANIPRSQVPAVETGQSKASDFDSDVKLAADLLVKQTENHFRLEKQQISSDAFREADVVYDRDLSRLRERYLSISPQRGEEFHTAYASRAEADIQTLRVKYYPENYSKPQPSTPTGAGEGKGSGVTLSGVTAVFWILIAFFFGAWFLWWLFIRKKPAVDRGPPLTANYGSANWAAHQLKPSSGKNISLGVMFGKSSRPGMPAEAPGAPVTSVPEAHTLIVARTRAGKGTRVIVPTLLRYSGSMLVIDPKGENAAITARVRHEQLHQEIHIINPWGEMKDLYSRLGFPPATFNPLDAIDRNDLNAVAVAQTLAATICPVAHGKDKFWQGSAANVLAAVFLWLADQPGEQKTLARAREIVTMSRTDFSKVLAKMAASTAFHGAIKEMVSQYIDLAEETYSGIMSNLAENTKFLSDPRIKAATNTSSVSLQTLRDVLTTVYVVIPHDRIETHATWLRLVIAAAMQAIKGRNALTAPPHHRCMFLIDEFGSIGHIADIPRDIALMSGYGLDFTLIVQGLDQLKTHYKDASGTILSNCGYKWFCYVNELDTAKYLSDSLGKATVRTVGKSISSGESTGGNATSGQSTTYGEMGRSLLTPDEILNLGRNVAILLHPYGPPYCLRPVDYWKLPETFAHLKAEYAHFYWDPPLSYDDNPYFKEPPDGGGKMSRAEALNILGLGEHSDRDAILVRYQHMMKWLEPHEDHIARKINAAKAVLLGE